MTQTQQQETTAVASENLSTMVVPEAPDGMDIQPMVPNHKPPNVKVSASEWLTLINKSSLYAHVDSALHQVARRLSDLEKSRSYTRLFIQGAAFDKTLHTSFGNYLKVLINEVYGYNLNGSSIGAIVPRGLDKNDKPCFLVTVTDNILLEIISSGEGKGKLELWKKANVNEVSIGREVDPQTLCLRRVGLVIRELLLKSLPDAEAKKMKVMVVDNCRIKVDGKVRTYDYLMNQNKLDVARVVGRYKERFMRQSSGGVRKRRIGNVGNESISKFPKIAE